MTRILAIGMSVLVFAMPGKYTAQVNKGANSANAAVPKSPKTASENPFDVRFRDVTKASGICFHHERAASDQKLYVETMGAGVAWIDYNQDGFLDAFFVNSGYTPFFHPEKPPQPALYRNNGDVTFTDVTEQAGIRSDGTFFLASP